MLDIDRIREAPELRRWSIGAELGRGGMGVVHAAADRDSGAPCAIKFVLPGMQAETAALVAREITNSRYLDHPNVVRAHDSGRVGETPFVVMELCAHGSLSDRVADRGPLPPDEAVPLILDTLAGLRYAHMAPVTVPTIHGDETEATGLVHRDIKPPNILLAGAGATAKVADFGLAKAFQVAGLSGLTRTGTTAGTPAFMPRQQVVDFKYATPAVDVWAAAASLYFALTATPPRDFTPGRDPWVTAYRTRPVPVRERGVPLPDRLADLLDAALVDDPEPAFTNAGELAGALREVYPA
jgi:serine/threonine protein kinase